MFAYNPVPLRLGQSWMPMVSPMPVLPPASIRLSQEASQNPLKPTAKGGLLSLGAIGLVSLGISAGGTWVGIHTGIKEKGFLSFTGWIVGITSGIGVLANLSALILTGAALAGLKDVPPAQSPGPGTLV